MYAGVAGARGGGVAVGGGGGGFAGGGGGVAAGGARAGGIVVGPNGGVGIAGGRVGGVAVGGGGGGADGCCANGEPTCVSDAACGAVACGTAACGVTAAGPAQLTYVGAGDGSYRSEYAYVGSGMGDFEYIAPRKNTYCVCWVSLITLLLLGLLLWLLFGPSTVTTTEAPKPRCGSFSCPFGFQQKPGSAMMIGNDAITCCQKTCANFACPAGTTIKQMAASIVGADQTTCCDQKACANFQCPALYLAKPSNGNLVGNDQLTCCDITCGKFRCAANTRLKAGSASIRGQSQALCCQAHKKICIVYGDPHSESFDGHHNDYYTTGEFWIVKSTSLKIQGRYKPTHITRGLSVTKECTIGGAMMKGHILRISSTSVTYDGNPILTGFPASYKAAGIFDVTYNDHGKILQPHRELGKDLKVLHFNFNDGTFIQINQWTNPEEGYFINIMIEMTPAPGGQDGHCGNFNGNAEDDDRNEVRKRIGFNGVEQAELIGFKVKTPIKFTFGGMPTISECASPLLISAHEVCAKEEGHFIPSMECLAKKCNDNKGSLVAH